MSKWRYQPVWIEENGERMYTLCEVHFNDADELETWTENSAMFPAGSSIAELSNDLVLMLTDAWRWEPVAFTDLREGMKFSRCMSAEAGEALAKFIEATAHNFSAGRPK